MRSVFQILFYVLLFCTNLHAQEFNLVIHSNSDFKNKTLDSYQSFKGDSITIYSECNQLLAELKSEGFLAASIDSIVVKQDQIIAYLFAGNKYDWSQLDYSNLDKMVVQELKLERTKLKTVNLSELNNIKSNILNYYLNLGYPFASVYFNDIEIYDSIIQASVKVSKDSLYRIDSIIIKGDAKITSTYIHKVIQLKSGDKFNQEKINKISDRVGHISFLSEIKPAEIEFKQDQVDLYLYLRNKKANSFNGLIGFSPNSEVNGDEDNDKLLITGELNLNLINSFGRGEELLLNWEKMESTTQKLHVGLMYPYLFKTNLGLDANFDLYKKDSTYLALNTGLGIRLYLNPTDYLKAYYRYKSSTRIGENKTENISINFADITSNVFGASYYLNNLDYPFNPRKGFRINLYAGAGLKKISNFEHTDDSLNINTDRKTIEVESGLNLELYVPIYNNIVFHFGNTSRYLDQFGDSEKDQVLFENELYRFGGAKSLKGFDESIFLASIYSIQNIEIKYLFERNSSFYIFWNGAYYYKNVIQDVTEDFPWGFGIGMDFETKAGVFSLSYALGKQFENPIEIRTAKIHFGYISRF